jgi:hypothetical protein
VRHFQGVSFARWAVTPLAYAVLLDHSDGHQTLVAWARTAEPVGLVADVPDGKAYTMELYGHLSVIGGDAAFTLAGATCDERDGCAVGGTPLVMMLPPGELSLRANDVPMAWQEGMPASSLTVTP